MGEIDRHAGNPSGWIWRHAADRPRAHRLKQRRLSDIFHERNVAGAEPAHERAVESAGFVTEEMLDDLRDTIGGRWSGRVRGHDRYLASIVRVLV
jgi:hypothetical protein